jgi:ubiquinone/menaquinone biosynthesis C-methylase UbiE
MAQPRNMVALEIATGTGELPIKLVRQRARIVIGPDFSIDLLVAARVEAARSGMDGRVRLAAAGAMRLPFVDASFDCVVDGFMSRHIEVLQVTFVELCRVLRNRGAGLH